MIQCGRHAKQNQNHKLHIARSSGVLETNRASVWRLKVRGLQQISNGAAPTENHCRTKPASTQTKSASAFKLQRDVLHWGSSAHRAPHACTAGTFNNAQSVIACGVSAQRMGQAASTANVGRRCATQWRVLGEIADTYTTGGLLNRRTQSPVRETTVPFWAPFAFDASSVAQFSIPQAYGTEGWESSAD